MTQMSDHLNLQMQCKFRTIYKYNKIRLQMIKTIRALIRIQPGYKYIKKEMGMVK